VDANTPGDYLLQYNASDPGGNAAAQVTRTVHVVDTTPPTIGCPSNIVVSCTSSNGATVTFATPSATDSCDSATTVTCAPPSGSVFAIGTTTVTCVATDASGNTQSCAFTVTVNGATAPTLTIIGYAGGVFRASFSSQNGCTYLFQSKNTLQDADWATVETVVGDGMVQVLEDAGATSPTRFYRLKIQ
jgi:hypothetical protein